MRMMKNLLYVAAALLMTVSCQKQSPDSPQMASISFYLENAPAEGEVGTKAVMPEVDVNEFHVYAVSGKDVVSGNSNRYSYLYKDIVDNGNKIEVEVGIYTVSAENVTADEALSYPDEWGQARYYAVSEPTPVVTGGTVEQPLDPVQFNLVCRMVNSAVHVNFDEALVSCFEDYTVTVYTDEDRQVQYDAANFMDAPVAYFEPKLLHYKFVGTPKVSSDSYTVVGTVALEAATNHNLNFRLDQNPGKLDIEINVDTSYEPVYEPVFIEPDFNQK